MYIKKILLSLIISLALLLATVAPVISISTYDEVFVDDSGLGEGHFDTIAEALTRVNPGGNVHIAAGTHSVGTGIIIDFDVSILGAGADITFVESTGDQAFWIQNANVKIDGLSLTSNGNAIAINLFGHYTVEISNNKISGNNLNGIYANILGTPTSPDGLDLLTEEDLIISLTNNEIYSNTSSGIKVICGQDDGEVHITDCSIHNNGMEGVSIEGVSGSTAFNISNNEIYSNGEHTYNTGIYVFDEQEHSILLDINNNYIHDEAGSGIEIDCHSNGISIFLFSFFIDDMVRIYQNDIISNERDGIYLGFNIYYESIYVLLDSETEDEVPYPCCISVFQNDLASNGYNGIYAIINKHTEFIPLEGDPQGSEHELFLFQLMTLAENNIYDNTSYGIQVYSTGDEYPDSPNEGTVDGAYNIYALSPYLVYRNEIYDNKSGGLAISGGLSYVINNLITANFSLPGDLDQGMPSAGILLSNALSMVRNNTVLANMEGVNVSESEMLLINNIIVDNFYCGVNAGGCPRSGYLDLDGDGSYEIYNNDVWNNTVNYNNIMDYTGYDGNISEDPLFYGIFDARLAGASPCIDAGMKDEEEIVFEDIEGTTRPQGRGIDMGCYEMPDNEWSPKWVQPLAMVSMANANSMWSCIMQNLPGEMDPEVEAMIEEVQDIMAQAGTLGVNPIYQNGLMYQALDVLERLNEKLECGCHS